MNVEIDFDTENARLQEILETMDVPEKRKEDYAWLNRNLFIRNKDNENIKEAMLLVKRIMKAKSIPMMAIVEDTEDDED